MSGTTPDTNHPFEPISEGSPYCKCGSMKAVHPAPAAVVSPSPQDKQRSIDIINLRFYSAMAHDFKWQTDIIHHSVIVQTLAEIAERLAASSPSPEGAEE